MAFFGFEEFKVSQGTTAEAEEIDLAALEGGEISLENPHVRLGDHVVSYWDCIYQYSQKKGVSGEPGPETMVNYVYYPVLSMTNPYLAEVEAFQKKFAESERPPTDADVPKITRLAMLAKTKEFSTIGEIPEGMARMSGTEGLVVNRIESLSSDEVNLLQQGFAGFDPDKVLLLEVGRKPASMAKSFGMMAGGGVIALLGLGWLVMGFVGPSARS